MIPRALASVIQPLEPHAFDQGNQPSYSLATYHSSSIVFPAQALSEELVDSYTSLSLSCGDESGGQLPHSQKSSQLLAMSDDETSPKPREKPLNECVHPQINGLNHGNADRNLGFSPPAL